MKVSIITPVFNAERFLQETAKSVLSQTYQNWEWVLVNDCSTDNSWEMILELVELAYYRQVQNSATSSKHKFIIRHVYLN